MEIFEAVGISAGVLSVMAGVVVTLRRHRKDYREYLAPELSRHGLHFESAHYHGFLRVGPFPIMAPRANRHVQTNVGSFVEYRVVACRDAAGKRFELWAELDFEFYVLQQISWLAELSACLPDSARALLKN